MFTRAILGSCRYLLSCHVMATMLGSIETEIVPLEKTYPRIKHELNRITRCGDMAIRIFQDGERPPSWIWSNPKLRHSIRRPMQINPTIERKMKWIGWPVAEIWPFEIRHITRGKFGTPILGKREVVASHRSYHLKEWCWFPIGCPVWPLHYPWLFGHNLPLNVCDSKNGVGHFGSKFWCVPFAVDPWRWVCRVRTHQANYFEEFQPMWSRYLGVQLRWTTCHSDRRNRLSEMPPNSEII